MTDDEDAGTGEDAGLGTVKTTPKKSNYKLELTAAPDEIDIRNKSQSEVTLTAKLGSAVAKGVQVQVEVSAEEPDDHPDGHTHEKSHNHKRPSAWLEAGGKKETSGKLVAKTDANGKITIKYTPPQYSYEYSYKDKKSQSKSGTMHLYISGRDKIVASLKDDSSVKSDDCFITTKVPDLEPMDGSDDGTGGEGYFFGSQGNHGGLFYGTDETNQALVDIAKTFWQKQKDCYESATNQRTDNGDNPCEIEDDKGDDYTIPDDVAKKWKNPEKMRITAMSLPWGGLSDINGDWKAPHKTHSTGRVADIGWANLEGKDMILLLRYVISKKNSNFKRFVSYEGGNYESTRKTKAPHFHVDFKQ